MPADLQEGFELDERDFYINITPFWSKLLEKMGLGLTHDTMHEIVQDIEEIPQLKTLCRLDPPNETYIGDRDD